MRRRRAPIFGLFGLLATCAAPAPPAPDAAAQISPRDFVLIPCGPAREDRPCVLVAAGGKRILFGAPTGVAASVPAEDLRQLDSVIVFSLRAVDIEGLDEVRNASWRAGRDTPLLTIGPRGVLDLVDGLNQAFEQADALRIVEEGIPPGGYDAAILTGREALRGQIVFDTGDVQVMATKSGYQIIYNGQAEVRVQPCSADVPAETQSRDNQAQLTLACETTEAELTWPLQTAHFVVKNQGAE